MMSSKPKSTNVDNLLAAIQRKAPSSPEPAPEPEPTGAPATAPAGHKAARGAAKRRLGGPVQFWLHDEDRRLVRELAAWLAGQGERPTDSMVIRAALRVAQTGGEFLAAYRQASQLDGRLKHHKT